MKVNVCLKTHLHRLISPFIEAVIQSVKMGNVPLSLDSTYFNLLYYLKGSQSQESQCLPKGQFTQLDFPF